jgi:hypothetical protein
LPAFHSQIEIENIWTYAGSKSVVGVCSSFSHEWISQNKNLDFSVCMEWWLKTLICGGFDLRKNKTNIQQEIKNKLCKDEVEDLNTF